MQAHRDDRVRLHSPRRRPRTRGRRDRRVSVRSDDPHRAGRGATDPPRGQPCAPSPVRIPVIARSRSSGRSRAPRSNSSGVGGRRRDRCSKFVGGVCDELAHPGLRLLQRHQVPFSLVERALQPIEHAVDRRRQTPHLGAGARARNPAIQLSISDLTCRALHLRERTKAESHQPAHRGSPAAATAPALAASSDDDQPLSGVLDRLPANGPTIRMLSSDWRDTRTRNSCSPVDGTDANTASSSLRSPAGWGTSEPAKVIASVARMLQGDHEGGRTVDGA